MTIGLIASDVVAGDVLAGLEALSLSVEQRAFDDVDDVAETVVADTCGGTLLAEAHHHVPSAFLGIEMGGIGGQTIEGVEATITGFDATGPCFQCLRRRVIAAVPSASPSTDTPRGTTTRFAAALAAHRLEQVATIDDLVGIVLHLDGSKRALHPVPTCACVEGYSVERPTLDAGDAIDPDTALDRAERALDERIGLITEVGEQASFPAPYYVARLADTAGFSDATAARLSAGVDIDWDGAFMRALGEGLERYCAGVYHLEDLPNDPVADAIPLDAFAIAETAPTPTDRWWPAIDLLNESNVAIPAEIVTFPPPERADVHGITTGLSLGTSTVDAILGGLYEVVERDACMLGWYSTFDPIALEVDRERYRTLVRRIASEGLGATALLMTQDIDIPVVTVVVHRRTADGDPLVEVPGIDDTDWPAFAVGSAARFDAGLAAERALAEAVQNWVELDAMGEQTAIDKEGAIGRYGSFPRVVRSLVEVEGRVPAASVGPSEVPTGRAALDAAVGAVDAAGLDVYAARTTTVDVERLGFEGVRVLVPQAQPLVRGDVAFTDRASTVPRTLGFRPWLDRPMHPYP